MKHGINYAKHPQIILRIDAIDIKLNSFIVNDLNPKWIKNIEYDRSEKYKSIDSLKEGAIIIYPKKNKRKKLLKTYYK